MVITHDPNSQFCKIERINKLTKRGTGAPNGEWSFIPLGNETLVDEPGDYVTILDGEMDFTGKGLVFGLLVSEQISLME